MSNTIRISELFKSIQGEGVRTGHKSIFCRSFLCNLKCPGFGLAKGEQQVQIPAVIKKIDQYKKYSDLPVLSTGCDSYPSSWGQFKRFSEQYDVDQLFNKILEIDNNPVGCDFVLTGGEPLLKRNQKFWIEMFEAHANFFSKFDSITFETNGTVVVEQRLVDALIKLNVPVIFSVSPKLPCSGQSIERTVKPEAIHSYSLCVLNIKTNCNQNEYHSKDDFFLSQVYFKYVISNQEDVNYIKQYTKLLQSELTEQQIRDIDVYVMPVGGTAEVHQNNAKTVAEIAMNNNWIFCYRVHCAVWRNSWGT